MPRSKKESDKASVKTLRIRAQLMVLRQEVMEIENWREEGVEKGEEIRFCDELMKGIDLAFNSCQVLLRLMKMERKPPYETGK